MKSAGAKSQASSILEHRRRFHEWQCVVTFTKFFCLLSFVFPVFFFVFFLSPVFVRMEERCTHNRRKKKISHTVIRHTDLTYTRKVEAIVSIRLQYDIFFFSSLHVYCEHTCSVLYVMKRTLLKSRTFAFMWHIYRIFEST